MNLEKEIKVYKEQRRGIPKEENIQETIGRAKEVFLQCEQERVLEYSEFLAAQFRLIRKRWWVLQALLLELAAILLPYLQEQRYQARCLGVLGVLFVVLLIPEFWKNKSCDCMQIEGTCFYSLRQIYAARMLLFGLVDVFVLTGFCILVRGRILISAEEVLVQFLFPMLVTACICFGTLSSKFLNKEGTTLVCCLLWSALWYVVVLNENLYGAVAFPVWCILFGIALAFFAGAVYKTIYHCNQYWEVTNYK